MLRRGYLSSTEFNTYMVLNSVIQMLDGRRTIDNKRHEEFWKEMTKKGMMTSEMQKNLKLAYTYLNKFGLLKRTSIDLPGEAGSIFLKEEKVGPVELATIAFGQRFEITPLQLITAVSSIANGGTYVKPRIVKKIINSQTGEVTDVPVEKQERVISEETAKNVLSMMQSVVEEGTGRNAQVEGYNIGGKTGTSEDGVNTNKYVTSFMGVGPTTNPEVVILVTLYNPTGEGGHQGGAWVVLTTHYGIIEKSAMI